MGDNSTSSNEPRPSDDNSDDPQGKQPGHEVIPLAAAAFLGALAGAVVGSIVT